MAEDTTRPDPEATVVDGDFPLNARRIGVPSVRFDMGTTLQSPCFWILIGAAGALMMVYLVNHSKK